MFVEDCYCLGFVHKTQGIAGELIVKTDLEQSEEAILDWESIFLSIDGILVPFFIEDIFLKAPNLIVVKLEDIKDEIEAQKYRGLHFYIDKNLFTSSENEKDFVQWLSFRVFDSEQGLVGILIDVQEYPSQLMLHVKSADKREYLIPANYDWLIKVDEEEKILEMHLPEGLLDLND